MHLPPAIYRIFEDLEVFPAEEERSPFSMPIEYKRCRHRATPRRIERCDEILRFRDISDKYGERYTKAIKEGEDFRCNFVGVIDADANNIYQAVSIRLLKPDKLGKLFDARLAPCRPHIQEKDFPVSVKDEPLQPFHVYRFDDSCRTSILGTQAERT